MTTIMFVVGYASMAQEVVTGGPSPPPPPSAIPSLPGLVVPIDENIVILLIAGLLAGVIYFYKRRPSEA